MAPGGNTYKPAERGDKKRRTNTNTALQSGARKLVLPRDPFYERLISTDPASIRGKPKEKPKPTDLKTLAAEAIAAWDAAVGLVGDKILAPLLMFITAVKDGNVAPEKLKERLNAAEEALKDADRLNISSQYPEHFATFRALVEAVKRLPQIQQ